MLPLNPKSLERDDQIALAYELWLKAYSLGKIAATLKIPKASAFTYVQEGKNRYEKDREQNLNDLRNQRVQQVEMLLNSRWVDLDACVIPNFDEVEFGDIEVSTIKRGYARDRSVIVLDILKLLQELSRLQGIYDTEKIDKYVVRKETNYSYDLSELTDEALLEHFNKIQAAK